jgi:hypothetical protein
MSKLHYVGPRVEISNHGIVYKKSKEDKYVYLMVALEILKDIDNDYEKKSSYSHDFENKALEEEMLYTLLKHHESGIEKKIEEEEKNYELKIQHKIEYIQNLPHLTDLDKEVWIRNIELMKAYTIQRAINKRYYIYCIQAISKVIKHKKIKEVTTPFNKNFFHVLNTIKGTLITGIPSLNTKVKNENDKNNNMVIKLYII